MNMPVENKTGGAVALPANLSHLASLGIVPLSQISNAGEGFMRRLQSRDKARNFYMHFEDKKKGITTPLPLPPGITNEPPGSRAWVVVHGVRPTGKFERKTRTLYPTGYEQRTSNNDKPRCFSPDGETPDPSYDFPKMYGIKDCMSCPVRTTAIHAKNPTLNPASCSLHYEVILSVFTGQPITKDDLFVLKMGSTNWIGHDVDAPGTGYNGFDKARQALKLPDGGHLPEYVTVFEIGQHMIGGQLAYGFKVIRHNNDPTAMPVIFDEATLKNIMELQPYVQKELDRDPTFGNGKADDLGEAVPQGQANPDAGAVGGAGAPNAWGSAQQQTTGFATQANTATQNSFAQQTNPIAGSATTTATQQHQTGTGFASPSPDTVGGFGAANPQGAGGFTQPTTATETAPVGDISSLLGQYSA